MQGSDVKENKYIHVNDKVSGTKKSDASESNKRGSRKSKTMRLKNMMPGFLRYSKYVQLVILCVIFLISGTTEIKNRMKHGVSDLFGHYSLLEKMSLESEKVITE